MSWFWHEWGCLLKIFYKSCNEWFSSKNLFREIFLYLVGWFLQSWQHWCNQWEIGLLCHSWPWWPRLQVKKKAYLDRGGHYKRTHNDKGRCGYEDVRGTRRRRESRAEQGKFSLWRAERRDGTQRGRALAGKNTNIFLHFSEGFTVKQNVHIFQTFTKYLNK